MRRRAEALGWTLPHGLELHSLADGRRLEPVVRGIVARFHMPSGVKELRLVSPAAQPVDTTGEPDRRVPGLCVGALRIKDGFGPSCEVALDDARLGCGFHDVEERVRRWTTGNTALPSDLWAGREDGFYRTVTRTGPSLPRWSRDECIASDPTYAVA